MSIALKEKLSDEEALELYLLSEDLQYLDDMLRNANGKLDAVIRGRDEMAMAATEDAKDAVISKTQELLRAVYWDVCWFIDAMRTGTINKMIDEINAEVATLEKQRDELYACAKANARAKANGQTIA
jgi:hypothetical protein